MTPTQAADVLGISYKSVIYHINKGTLKAEKNGVGQWVIDPASVEIWERPPLAEETGNRGGRRPGAGRPPGPKSDRKAFLAQVYLGREIQPDEVRLIREHVPPDMRAAILYAFADLYKRDQTETLKRAFEILGWEYEG